MSHIVIKILKSSKCFHTIYNDLQFYVSIYCLFIKKVVCLFVQGFRGFGGLLIELASLALDLESQGQVSSANSVTAQDAQADVCQ